MRGLIIKDLLFIKSIWKNLLIMLVGSLLISISLGNYLLTICVLPMMLLTSGISTFQTDEFYNSECFILGYPLSRKEIVKSKYLFTLLMVIISTYIGLLLYALIHFIINPGPLGLNVDMIKQLLMLEAAGLIVDSIFYPVIYKYGCEKSRFVLMSIVILLLGIASIFSVYINVIDVNALNLEQIMTYIQEYGIYILSVVVVIALIISYYLSILFYRHKDY